MSDQLDQIERYLRGELSQEEAANFEDLLLKDDALKEQFDEHKQLLKGLELGFNKELKELLVAEEAKMDASSPLQVTHKKNRYPLIGLAAAVALLITAYFTLWNNNQAHNKLYAQYYNAYPNVEVPVSRSSNTENNPFALYEQRNFAAALSLFEEILRSEPDNTAILFYASICQLELDRPEEATSFLQRVINQPPNKYTRPAKWYQALGYLKMGETDASEDILRQLQQGEDSYSAKAKDLLSDM